jgi:hypothetical protein
MENTNCSISAITYIILASTIRCDILNAINQTI